jgi:hypothetical protein
MSKKPIATCIMCSNTVTSLVMGEEFDFDESKKGVGFLLADEGLPEDKGEKLIMEDGSEDDTMQGDRVLKKGERLLVACGDCMRDMIDLPSANDIKTGRRKASPLTGKIMTENVREEDVTPQSIDQRQASWRSRFGL